MSKFGEFIITIIAFIVIALLILTTPVNYNHYEYIDLDNNKGIAEYCSYSNKGFFSGGQGTPVCTLKDSSIKQVKEYKFVEDDCKSILDLIRRYR